MYEVFLKSKYKCTKRLNPIFQCILFLLPPLSFKISIKDKPFHIYVNTLGLHLSPECLLNFLSNLFISPCMGKIFKFMMFTLLENVLILNLSIFTRVPLSSHNSPPSFYYHTLFRGKLFVAPGNIFLKICFSQQHEGLEETMICLIKIHSENMKMTWNIRLFIFCAI